MKREREDSDDRDPTEVRQPRTGGHGKGRGGKQERSRAPRSVPNMDTDSGDPQMKVEFTILRGMVGAVIGRGGNTVQGIRNRTGATVHIHSAMPKEKETSVELNGTRKQIEEAYDELRAVMMTVDEEYTENHDAFSMASLELRTLPKMIGCLIGKAGSKIRSIEEASGAKVKVEPQQDGDEFQDVIIHGNIDAVCKAHEMVQEALQSFDPTRAKTTRRTHTNQATVSNAQSMNVVDLSAQSLVGSNVGKSMVSPMLSQQTQQQQPQQQQQTPIVIQAPAGGLAPTPTILVLQADGTYIPAQVVNNMTSSAASYPPQMATAPVTLNSYQQQQQPMQQQQQQQTMLTQQNLLATQPNSALQAPQQQQPQQQSPQQQQMFQPVPQSMLQQYTVAGAAGTGQQQQQQQLPSNQQIAALLAAQQQQQVMPIASTAGTTTYVQGYGMGITPAVKMDSSGTMKLEMGDQGVNAAQTIASQAGVPMGLTTATPTQEQWDAPTDTTYGTWNG